MEDITSYLPLIAAIGCAVLADVQLIRENMTSFTLKDVKKGQNG